MNKSIVFGIMFLLLISCGYALDITAPSNGSSIYYNSSYSWNDTNTTTTPIYQYNIYLNNSLMTTFSNAISDTTVANYSDTSATVFELAYQYNLSGNRLLNVPLIVNIFTAPSGGGASTFRAFLILNYTNGSVLTTPISSVSVGNTKNGCIEEVWTFTSNVSNTVGVNYIQVYTDEDSAGRQIGVCGIIYANDSVGIRTTSFNPYSILNYTGNYILNVSGLNYTSVVLKSNTTIVNMPYNALLNISATNFSGTAIGFNGSINDSRTFTSSGSSVLLDVLRSTAYSFTIDNSSYALNSFNLTTNVSSSQSKAVVLLPNNAINVSIFNEVDGSAIYSIATLTIDGGSTYSINHTGYIDNIDAGSHTLLISISGFNVKSYYVTIPDRTFQNLNIYLNNGTAVLFNYYDVGGNPISGVLLNVYSYVNGTLSLVESKVSELGKAQIYVLSNKYYAFNSSKSGYDSYDFSLNPVLFTSYDIPLSQIISGNVTPSAYVFYNPLSFYNGMNKSFTIEFISPYYSLTYYNWSLTYPGGSLNDSGTSTSGELFSNNFAIPGGTTPGTVTLRYFMLLGDGSNYSQTLVFRTSTPWVDKTLVNMGDEDYGMLIGDKIFWLTIMLLLLMGFAYLGAGFEVALVFGGIFIILFMNNGFIDTSFKPIFYISGFFIILLLGLRAWGNR